MRAVIIAALSLLPTSTASLPPTLSAEALPLEGSAEALEGSAEASDPPSVALQAALNATIAARGPLFTIRQGTYRFGRADLIVNEARDLAIAGSGAVTLLFTCNFGVVLRSTVNVTLRNVTVDYDEPCFSQGPVTAVGESGGSFTYTVDDGFPLPDAALNPRFGAQITHIIIWHAANKSQACHPGFAGPSCQSNMHGAPKHLGGRSYSVVGASPQIGQIVTLGPRQGHTLVLSNASRCVIESVTIHGASDMAIGEYGGGGANVLRGNSVVRHPTRTPQGLLVSNGDIFMSSGASHGPLVEGNEWSYSGDDCVNIQNYVPVVLRVEGSRALLMDSLGNQELTGASSHKRQSLARQQPPVTRSATAT